MALSDIIMSWIATKAFLARAWLWTKEHWQLPFLMVWTLLVYIMTRRNTDSLVEVLNAKNESYKKQVEALKRSHNDEILKRNKLSEEYAKALQAVHDAFEKRKEDLEDSQREEIKQIVIASKGAPSKVREKIEKEFGFKYVD
jgi:hypothetical protein